jgi:hypothetical protein
MDINIKSDGIGTYGKYAYRAYAVPLKTGNWEAWYVIHTPDYKAILSGPTKLPWQFSVGEAASAAAVKKAKWEIDHAVGGLGIQPAC